MTAPLRTRGTALFVAALVAAALALGTASTASLAKTPKTPKSGLIALPLVGAATLALKEHLLKKAPEALDNSVGAVLDGDKEKSAKAERYLERVSGEVAKDAFIPKFAERKFSAAKEKLKAAVGKIKRVYKGGDTVDARAAFGDAEEQEVRKDSGESAHWTRPPEERRKYLKESGALADHMLPILRARYGMSSERRGSNFPDGGTGAAGWDAEKPEPPVNSVVDRGLPGNGTRQEAAKAPDVWAERDPWAAVVRESRNPTARYGVVDEPKPEIADRSDADADDRDGYAAALGRSDYRSALRTLEAKEAERRRQAELAEQRRLARLEEERRQAEAERRRQARSAEWRRARQYDDDDDDYTVTYVPHRPSFGEVLGQSLQNLTKAYQDAIDRKWGVGQSQPHDPNVPDGPDRNCLGGIGPSRGTGCR